MAGKCRPSLRRKTLENVKHSNLSQTDKDCITEVFKRYEETQREGEWKMGEDEEYEYGTCSVCGYKEFNAFSQLLPHNFCPNCGAKMQNKYTKE